MNRRYIEEMVYLMELSNLRLAELEAYDRLLDIVIDRALPRPRHRLARARHRLGSLRRWTGASTLQRPARNPHRSGPPFR